MTVGPRPGETKMKARKAKERGRGRKKGRELEGRNVETVQTT